jgi:hypothetical protein
LRLINGTFGLFGLAEGSFRAWQGFFTVIAFLLLRMKQKNLFIPKGMMKRSSSRNA